jgi:hypothetical protein
VGKERVILKYHGNITPVRGEERHIRILKEDLPRRRILKPRYHPEGGGFSAVRRPEEGRHLPLLYIQGYPVYRDEFSIAVRLGEYLGHIPERYADTFSAEKGS